MVYIKKGETYYGMTSKQSKEKRGYVCTIELVRNYRTMGKVGYEVYSYEGTKKLTHGNGEIYFSSLKKAKVAAEKAYC